MATYGHFLEGVVQHIQIRSFKNGDTTHSVKMAGVRETFLDASVGDSPLLHNNTSSL